MEVVRQSVPAAARCLKPTLKVCYRVLWTGEKNHTCYFQSDIGLTIPKLSYELISVTMRALFFAISAELLAKSGSGGLL